MKTQLACGHRARPLKSRIVKQLTLLWCQTCGTCQPKAERVRRG